MMLLLMVIASAVIAPLPRFNLHPIPGLANSPTIEPVTILPPALPR
jgi:hypothetical protein